LFARRSCAKRVVLSRHSSLLPFSSGIPSLFYAETVAFPFDFRSIWTFLLVWRQILPSPPLVVWDIRGSPTNLLKSAVLPLFLASGPARYGTTRVNLSQPLFQFGVTNPPPLRLYRNNGTPPHPRAPSLFGNQTLLHSRLNETNHPCGGHNIKDKVPLTPCGGKNARIRIGSSPDPPPIFLRPSSPHKSQDRVLSLMTTRFFSTS